MEWLNLLNVIGGALASLGGYGVFKMVTKSGRKEIKADADAKVQEATRLMIANYEERIKELHENIKMLNDSEHSYIERISQQNHALNDKTARIRELQDMLNNSELEVNKVNDKLSNALEKITELTEERDKYRMWQCHNADCANRLPPNAALKGKRFS